MKMSASRRTADLDDQTRLVREFLQGDFPQAIPRGVAAARVGGDVQPSRLGVTLSPQLLPPASDRGHRELGGVVRDADRHARLIQADVVHAIRDRLAQLGIGEVMSIDLLRLALLPISLAWILVIPKDFLLLRVDRDGWLTRSQLSFDPPGDVPKLRIAIGMLLPLAVLLVGRQAVFQPLKQPRDLRVTDHQSHLLEQPRQLTRTQTGPPQRRFRIAPRLRLHNRI